MIYDQKYSAVRKVIFDCIFFFMIIILFVSGSFSVWSGSRSGALEIWDKFFSIVIGLLALLLAFSIIYKVAGLRNSRGDWRIRLDFRSIRLDTPDDEEVEAFEYEFKKITKFSREAY